MRKKDKKMNIRSWSLFDRNFHRQALNLLPGQNLSEIARPWSMEFGADVKVQNALNDLNTSGARQRRALDFLGLDLVATAA